MLKRHHLLVATAILALSVVAGAQPIEEITLTGPVAAVDHYQRILTVRAAQGNLVVVDVPVSVTPFDQIRVGDVVTLSYYDRVTLRPKPPGEPAVDRMFDAAASPTPGATIPAQRVTTVTFTGLDAATRVVTFRGPKGAEYARRLADTTDAGLLRGLRPGDRVDVIWSEAIRLTTASGSTQAVDDPDALRHRFTISALVGIDNTFAGKMIEESTGRTTGGAPIILPETSYDDIYGSMEMYKIGVGYRLSPRTELAVNFVYERSSADPVTIGTVGAAAVPLDVGFDDYKYWGVEGGQRFFFARVRFTPFVGYLVGLNRHQDIRGVFINVPANVTPGLAEQDGKFFEKSWAFSFGPTGGFLIGVGPIELMAETQIRFMGGLSDVDWLVEEGLRDINGDSERWSIPFLVGARIRF